MPHWALGVIPVLLAVLGAVIAFLVEDRIEARARRNEQQRSLKF